MSTSSLASVLDQLARHSELDDTERRALEQSIESLPELAGDVTIELARALEKIPAEERTPLVAAALRPLASTRNLSSSGRTLSAEAAEIFLRLYRAAPPTSARHLLPKRVAESGPAAVMPALADTLVADPPLDPRGLALVFSPLVRGPTENAARMFPNLLAGLESPALAAAVLDLANYLVRSEKVSRHPAADRGAELAALLGGIAQQLNRLQEQPPAGPQAARERASMVADAVALAVGLCDALAWIGDRQAIGKLHQALTVGHRRLQTEAAAALARLGEDAGLDALVELAGLAASRTRALAYLTEQDALERARPEDRTPQARIEGDVAAYLSEPTQFGMPPAEIELIDHARMFWPGSPEPVDCYLFQYTYMLAGRELSGIAMGGPVLHAILADVEDLPPSDIYAMVAGWSAEHEELRIIPAEQLDAEAHERWPDVQISLEAAGYCELELVALGMFFGTEQWVVTARRDEHAGVVVFEEGRAEWYAPSAASTRPPGPRDFYYLHRGRRLLRAFNSSTELN